MGMGVTNGCQWLHEHLETLPPFRYQDDLILDGLLPENGVYFFYQRGETWGHGGSRPRIVRVGINRGNGNFPDRIAEHFLTGKRSIFRGHIGRALLHGDNDGYLKIWTLDFIDKARRLRRSTPAELESEARIQRRVTAMLNKDFWFRFILVGRQAERETLEKRFIGTVAQCSLCKPSKDWLGHRSPVKRICNGKMWLVKDLSADGMRGEERRTVRIAIAETRKWIKLQQEQTA